MLKRNILLYGEGGCLTGDAFIRYYVCTKEGKVQNSKGGTLEYLFCRFNNTQRAGKGAYQREVTINSDFYVNAVNEHNQVIKQKIRDVVMSGNKEVYKLTTVCGKSVKATADHEIYTDRGWRPLSTLTVEDKVYINPNKNNKPAETKVKRSKAKEILVKYHKSAPTKIVNGCRYFRLPYHRAIYEARENFYTLEEYRKVLNRASPSFIEGLWSIPEGFSIHHIDGNHFNNELENLMLLSEPEHQRLHRELDNSNSARNVYVEPSSVANIEYIGVEPTYDIVCYEPYRNFIANEIVVHNSGKSASIATIFKLLPKNPDIKIRFLATEANALDGLEEGLSRHNIDLKKGQLHYMVCRPTYNPKYTSANVVRDFKQNFLDLSEGDALKVKIGAGDRSKHSEFISILEGLAVFKGTDFKTGEVENLGDYLQWDANTILVVDSMTACVDYLVSTVKGSRSATTQKDYGDVQSNFMSKIIIPLTEQCNCSVIMLGHPTIGEDQTVKQPKADEDKVTKLYPRTFGQSLNNVLVSKFSEVIYSYVDHNDKFFWAGKKTGVATSPRKIPREDKLEPDFSKYPIFGLTAS